MLRMAVRGVWVSVLVIAACAAPAQAGRWTPAERVSAAGLDPHAAIGADGTAVVAWRPVWSMWANAEGLRAVIREPDGRYVSARTLEQAGQPWFEVAVSDNGDAFVAWAWQGVAKVSIRPAGGAFGPPQILDSGLDEYAQVDVSADADGEAVVAWTGRNGIAAAARRAGEAAFGPPDVVGHGGSPNLVTDAGVTSLAWDTGGGVAVSRRTRAASFGPPELVRPPGSIHFFELSGYADGSLALLVMTSEGGTMMNWAATAPPGDAFRAPALLPTGSSGAYDSAAHQVAIGAGPGGRALVALSTTHWTAEPHGYTGNSDGLMLQRFGPDGVPRPPARAVNVGYSADPAVGFDRTGTAVALFGAGNGTWAINVPLDGSPCGAERIADGQPLPAAPVLDAGETGLFAWHRMLTSHVNVALHRPAIWCPPPPPAPLGPPTSSPEVLPTPPASVPLPDRARAPQVARTARVGRRLRTAFLRLRCTRASSVPCRGRLDLRLPARRRPARAARRLGTAHFGLQAGQTRRLRVRLNRAARKPLRRGAVRTRARVKVPGAPARTRLVSLRPGR